ncbi:DUF1801 domain-containing protein [Candidatus Kapabacteria bacterium]|nr:DUF1801 domain-containing protein [Candidatus Kapabacteria bacterium]
MSDLKTQLNDADPLEFINSVENETRKKDALRIVEIMESITKEKPKMWGDSIIGFGSYHYKYASGREGDWMKIGLSPRKASLTLYLTYGFELHQDKLKILGKHKTGKACLYIKNLKDVDQNVLTDLIRICYDNCQDSITN